VSERIAEIQKAVEKAAKVPAEHLESKPIREIFNGKVVWEGVIEVFTLLGHEKASRAYGWRIGEGQSAKYKTVLEIPPIKGAHDAVRMAIMADY
jgi:hypothetical protein